MLSPRYLFDRLRDLHFSDFAAVLPMLMALCVRPFSGHRYANTWLICEEPAEARDNGYHFFRFLRQSHPEQKAIYAIADNSVDRDKVSQLGPTVRYGSVRHWIIYFSCHFNISSSKGGKPNAALCAFLELNGLFRPRNIFLQHGVIINDLRWLYADRSCIDLFVTSTVSETHYVRQHFGYDPSVVRMTGLCRFDNLHDAPPLRRRIVVMPTWRYWFNLQSKKHSDTDADVAHSEYLHRWREFLDAPQLAQLLDKHGVELVFFPHRNMQPHLHSFTGINPNVVIASWRDFDIQELLKSASMLVTDYSSVFFDMVYMRRPVAFYQFDEDLYRKYQYGKGYFDYHDNPFGRSHSQLQPLIDDIQSWIEADFRVPQSFLDAHTREFPLYDTLNSKRLYDELAAL